MTPVLQVEALLERAREAEAAGGWDEAVSCYEIAVQRARVDGTPAHVIDAFRNLGRLYNQRGSPDHAQELFEAGLAVAEANDLPAEVASMLNCLAIVAQFRGAVAEAEALYQRARDLAVSLGDDRLRAKVDQNLGSLANIRGDARAAIERYRSALECYQRLGDGLAAARALNNIGMAHVRLEEWPDAERCYVEALHLADRHRDMDTIGTIEGNRAELWIATTQHARAREACDRAFEIFSRLDARRRIAEVHKLYAMLFRDTSKAGLARHHFANASQLAEECRDALLQAEVLREWALAHLAAGENPEALQCLNRAHKLFNQLEATRELLDLDRRLDDLESTFLRVVQQWAETIESKDRYTAGHCERVANYACMLAEAVGFKGRDLTWIRMGGFLHDVGKIAVPVDVLNKPGKLTAEEWALMQSHTTAGDEIVAKLDFPYDIRPMVRSHHERWDGTGYPDGLSGERIPYTARILCVADVYDALTTSRSYRPAMTSEDALQIMGMDSGELFDPKLFEIFRGLVAQPAQLRIVA